MSHRIVLLEAIHPVAVEQLTAAGFQVELLKTSLKEDELIKKLEGVQALGIRSKTQVTPRVLESAKDLLAVGAFCIGTNQIALERAMHLGVPVFNAPFSNTRSVAELALAEIVMLSRQLGDRVRELHAGRWRKVATGAHEVRGKTLGIIGYGHIGRQLGVLAEQFGLRVLFHDVVQVLPMGNNRSAPLDELLAQSDFVTLHVPETPQTKGMMGAAELAKMKKGASLINASRGTVVDIDALAAALRSGQLGGAAIDVYPEEPESNDTEGFSSPLQGLPNVILTPHIGGSTAEAQESIGREVATSLTKFLDQGSTLASVNFPQVELGATSGTHRIVHVHRNVPGVLRDVNRIVSDHDANISAQVLATNAEIGYLVMDVARADAAPVCAAMAKLETTVRVRAV